MEILNQKNALKLQAGKNYITRADNVEKTIFYMLSPEDYESFFLSLKIKNLVNFNLFTKKNYLDITKARKS